jgi:hypothetical protein
VVDPLCISHKGKRLSELFARREAEKNALYKRRVESSGAEFVTFAVSAQGALSPMSLENLRRLCAPSDFPVNVAASLLGSTVVAATARTLLEAEAKFAGVRNVDIASLATVAGPRGRERNTALRDGTTRSLAANVFDVARAIVDASNAGTHPTHHYDESSSSSTWRHAMDRSEEDGHTATRTPQPQHTTPLTAMCGARALLEEVFTSLSADAPDPSQDHPSQDHPLPADEIDNRGFGAILKSITERAMAAANAISSSSTVQERDAPCTPDVHLPTHTIEEHVLRHDAPVFVSSVPAAIADAHRSPPLLAAQPTVVYARSNAAPPAKRATINAPRYRAVSANSGGARDAAACAHISVTGGGRLAEVDTTATRAAVAAVPSYAHRAFDPAAAHHTFDQLAGRRPLVNDPLVSTLNAEPLHPQEVEPTTWTSHATALRCTLTSACRSFGWPSALPNAKAGVVRLREHISRRLLQARRSSQSTSGANPLHWPIAIDEFLLRVPRVMPGQRRGKFAHGVLLMRLCAYLALWPVSLPLRIARSAIENCWVIAAPVITACLVVTLCCSSRSILNLVRSIAPKPVGDVLQLTADIAGVASFAVSVGTYALSRCASAAAGILANYVSARDLLVSLWSSSPAFADRMSIGVPSFVSALGNVPFNPFLNASSSSSFAPLVATTIVSQASIAFAPSIIASLRSGVVLSDARSLAAVVVGHAAKAASVSPAAALAGLVLLIVISGVLRAWSDGE